MTILEKAPALLLMVISLFGFLSGEIIKCSYTRKNTEVKNYVFFYTALISGISSLFMLSLWGFRSHVSLYTVIMGVIFGIAVFGQIAASAFAMRIGPWSYTAVMMSLSSVIPALAGPILWHEPLGFLTVIGIVLTMVCFVLSAKTDGADEAQKKRNLKWFLLSIVASLSTGGIGILQKMHQSSAYKNELVVFLAISFAVSALLSFSLMGSIRTELKNKQTLRASVSALFIVAGIGTGLNHLINLYLSGAMESAVFFPMMSGGELIFVTLASMLLFKEKLSPRQWIGLVCGIAAVIILCI